MKAKARKSWLVPAICYAAALLVYFGACGVNLLLDSRRAENGQLQPRELAFDNFYAESIVLRENEDGGSDLVSTDDDPRLIYSPGEAFYAGRFTFAAEETSRPGGEIVLYYTTRQGEAFSEQRRLSARQAEDGSWYFDLGGRKVTALRFDPGTRGGVLWRNWRITLNDEKPVSAYFLPSAREVFLLLFLPGFVAAAVLEVLNLRRDFALGRKAKQEPETGF